MTQQERPMEIIRQSGMNYVVKIGRKYYAVSHDPSTGMTSGIADKFAGTYREMKGWTHDAIRFVAKGHKRETALVYYNTSLRKQARLATQDETVCDWCNGSGKDPRNNEWSCQRC